MRSRPFFSLASEVLCFWLAPWFPMRKFWHSDCSPKGVWPPFSAFRILPWFQFAYDTLWPGSPWIYPVWDAGSCLFTAFGKISAVISWTKFSGSSSSPGILMTGTWDPASGSGSAPFCSLALPFTRDAGSIPMATSLMPSSSSRTATGSVCWGSEFQSLYFSVLNLPSGASLYFYFSVKTASFHLKHAHDWELKHFYHDDPRR